MKDEILVKLDALANKTRLKILLLLLQEDLCVCELQEILKIEQSRLSHQLRILRYLGLVETKKKGKWIIYSVDEELRENKLIKAIQDVSQLTQSELEDLNFVKKNRIWERRRDLKTGIT